MRGYYHKDKGVFPIAPYYPFERQFAIKDEKESKKEYNPTFN